MNVNLTIYSWLHINAITCTNTYNNKEDVRSLLSEHEQYR